MTREDARTTSPSSGKGAGGGEVRGLKEAHRRALAPAPQPTERSMGGQFLLGAVLLAGPAQADFPSVPKGTYEALKLERSAAP